MNANVDPASGPSPAPPLPSPGALLRLARERAGLGLEDLAAQIKLARNTLEALENDNFASLSEPVYVRGYYRKIAKSLGMPDREVLDAYDLRHPAHAAAMRPQPLPLAGGVDAGISRRAQGQGLLIAGGILVLAMGLLFLFSEPPKTPRLAPMPAEPELQAQPAEEAVPDVDGMATEPANASSTAAPTTHAAPGAGAPVAAQVQSPAPIPTQTQPQVSKPASSPAASPATSAAPAATATQLVLQFTESSFVRIEDSRGRTLLIGLVKGGERPALDGHPPYTVFLGNAANVKVFRNGKAVEFTADINAQNGTARFTVP